MNNLHLPKVDLEPVHGFVIGVELVVRIAVQGVHMVTCSVPGGDSATMGQSRRNIHGHIHNHRGFTPHDAENFDPPFLAKATSEAVEGR